MREAVLLTGSLGLGHEMMARCCASLLDQSGWRDPQRGQHVPARARRGRRRGTGLRPAGGHARVCTTGCTSPTCARAAGWPRPMDRAATPGWCPRCRPTWTGSQPTCCSACSPAGPGRGRAGRARGRGAAHGRAVHRRDRAPDLGPPRAPTCSWSPRRPRRPRCAATCPGPGSPWCRPGPARVLRRPVRRPRPGRRWAMPAGAQFCVLVMGGGWGFGPLRGPWPNWPPRGCTCWPWPAGTSAVEQRLRALARRDAPGPSRSASPTGSPS